MTETVPTVDQIHAYLLAKGWRMGESGSAAYLTVTMGHTVRMLHEPTEYDRGKAVFDIALAEGRHPTDVREDIATGVGSQPAVMGKSDAPALVASLRQRRLDLGLSQREVARRAGFAPSMVHEYESGNHEPTLFSLVAWADALGCDVAVAARAAVAL